MPLRLPFDSLTLLAAAQELGRDLTRGIVQRVGQPGPSDLLLTIRRGGSNYVLLLSCDANYARAHLTSVKRTNPPSPPAFCMLCRKYIEGGRVVRVAQRGFDRILDIEIEGTDGRSYLLVAELMGKHSNLLLLSDDGVILDAAKRITRKISRYREALPGKPYIAPPEQTGRLDPFAATIKEIEPELTGMPTDPEAHVARWMGRFAGMSPFLAQELSIRARTASPEEAWEEIFGAARRGEWMPVLIRDERGEAVGAYPFPTVQADPRQQHERDSMNVALDHYYGAALPRAELAAARHELETAIERALKSRERQRESLERSLQEVGRAEHYRESGELLLANLHQVEPQADSVTVEDYYQGGERTIELDPRKSSRENAEAYFRRYRKAKDGAEIQRTQLQKTEADLVKVHTARAVARGAEDITALRALRTEMTASGLLRREGSDAGKETRKPDFQGKKIRVFTAPEGWDIYVGENSEANDYLTTRIASPNDIWLHVRAAASAHVVIRTRNNPSSVPQSVIHRAALMAAQHSPSKHSSTVPVDYTLKKFVRRPRGAASGAALYQNEKTVYVSPKG